MPGILIVDDHPLIRRAVRSLLEGHNLPVCGEAADGRAAIERATDLRPDVILMDIFMPLMNGIEAGEELHRVLPATKILFLTLYEATAFQARTDAWSHGVISKSAAATQLVPALKALLAAPDQAPALKYPWEQLVAEAFAAPRDALPAKINLAERAIAARLGEEIERDERVALKNALHAMKRLISESRAPVQEDRKKYGAA